MTKPTILALAALLVLATACDGASTVPRSTAPGRGIAEGEPNPSGGGPPSMGVCAPGATECVDVVVGPEGSDPLVEYRPIAVEGDVPGDGTLIGGGELLKSEGSRIEIGFWMGIEDCYGVERVDVSETESTVAVDITVAPRDPSQACIELAEARSLEVGLAAPLGARALEVGGVPVSG